MCSFGTVMHRHASLEHNTQHTPSTHSIQTHPVLSKVKPELCCEQDVTLRLHRGLASALQAAADQEYVAVEVSLVASHVQAVNRPDYWGSGGG